MKPTTAIDKILELANGGPKARRENAYDVEKVLGIRQPSGASKLKKLSPIHKQIIAMHLSGYSTEEVANNTGYSHSHVYKILSDPLAAALISSFSTRMDNELRAMEPLTISAMRDALESGDMKDRLKAVDIFNKMAGHYIKEEGASSDFGGHTAESLVAQALSVAQDAVRNGNNPRGSIIKGDASDAKVISNSTDLIAQT